MHTNPTLLAVTRTSETVPWLDALFGERLCVLRAGDGPQAMKELAEHPEIELLAVETEGKLPAWVQCVHELPQYGTLPVLALVSTPEAAQAALLDGAADVLRVPGMPAEGERRALNLIRMERMASEGHERERNVYQVMDHMPYGIGLYRVLDDRLEPIYVNTELARLAGSTPQPGNPLPMLRRADADELLAHLLGPEGDEPFAMECDTDGPERACCRQFLNAYSMRHLSSRSRIVLISLTDVTRQHDAEQALQRTSNQLRTLMDTVPGGIIIFAVGGPSNVVYFNDTVAKTLGYTRDEYIAIAAGDLKQHIVPEDRPRVEELLDSLPANPRRVTCDFRVNQKSGEQRHITMSCAPESGDGKTCICNAVFLDITKEKTEERKSELALKELRYRAEHDTLTGICNRESFCLKTDRMLRQHPEQRYTLAVLDIDRFKVVNDLFGKEAGDRVLLCLADTLKARHHQQGTYARMESDRFALCCPEGMLDCEQFHQDFQRRLTESGLDYHVEVSIGLYRVHNLNVSVQNMCDRAAMAMRTIKSSAVVRFAYYDEHLRQTLLEEQEIIDDMYDALSRGEFVPYVQPIYNISTGKPVSAEVLIRWKHPRRGFISPALFVPLFERNGFITKLDSNVWESACRLLAQWKAAGCGLPLSVNISRVDLYSPKLCEQLQALVNKYGLTPDLLKLEITESAYTENPGELLVVVNRLREAGFHILMDDFGSGYSSLNILKDMPVDTLKIDMRFLAELETSARAASIITSVVRMAKWLNIPVIAEGVETQQQVDFLRSIGCNQVQGFFYAKPMPADELETLLLGRQYVQKPCIDEPADIDVGAVWDANAQFNTLLNGMISGIGLYELAGDVLEVQRVNDAYYDLFGMTPSQLFAEGRNVLARLNPADRQAALDACRRALQTRRVEQVTVRQYHKDGRMLWIDVKLRYISKAGDHPVFYMTLNDCTQQREFEMARAFQQYTDALRSLYRSLFELDFANQRVRLVYQAGDGVKLEEGDRSLVEARAYYLERVHPDDRDGIGEALTEENLAATLRARTHLRLEARMRLDDSERYQWSAFHVFSFADAARGRTLYLLGVQDIDARKRGQRLAEENHILQAKQKEQERYLALMEETGTTLLDWDLTKNSRFYCSSGFAQWRMSDYPLEEVARGKHLKEIVFEDDRRVALMLMSKAAQFKECTAVVRLQKKVGGMSWCRVRVLVTRGAEDKPTRIAATISEIDEQIRMREDYVQAQAQFQAFADNYMVGLGVYEVWGGQSHATYLSDGFYRMMGYEDKAQFHQDHTESAYLAVHPDDVAKFDSAVAGIIRTREPFTLEYRAVSKNGDGLWLRTETCALPQKEGEHLRLLAVIANITELKETQRHLQCLLDDMPVGMGIFDLEGDAVRPRYLNARMPELLGYSHEELMTGDFSTLGDHLERLQSKTLIHSARQRAAKGAYITQETLQMRRKDGASIWVQSVNRIAQDDAGNTACYVMLSDVTENVVARRRLRWQEERYRLLVEHTDSILFDYDVERDVMTFTLRTRETDAHERTLDDHLRRLEECEIVQSSFRDVYRAALLTAIDHPAEGTLELLADFTGDGYRWCRMYYVSVADESGRVFRVVGRVLSIDREKEIEERLRIERRYRQALLAETLYVYDVNPEDGRVSLLHAAPKADERFLPWQAYRLQEGNRENFHPEDWPALQEMIAQKNYGASDDQTEARRQFRIIDRAGEWVWVEAAIHPLSETENGKPRLLIYLKVVDTQRRREEELRTRAELDIVSGVLNRATTEQRVNEALATGQECAFLLLDVDNFKHINDTLGHAAGDSAIRAIGEALREGVRSGDVVGRVGGDEFAVLLAGIACRESALKKANALLLELGERCMQGLDGLRVTASIGVTIAPEDGSTFHELYQKSDQAMYRAKSAGKGRPEAYCAEK